MKMNSSFNVLLMSLIVSCIFSSCSKNPQGSGAMSPDDRSGFSLVEIKSVFESDYTAGLLTRADGKIDESEALAPGSITPLWNTVSIWSDERLFQADMLFDVPCEYRLLRWDEAGNPSLSRLPSRLVVLKDSATDQTASYLCFLIPDENYAASAERSDFSGLVVYTLLSGAPVSVGRFDGGTLSDSASFWDNTRTWEENADKMTELLQDVYVARVRSETPTRAMGGKIPPVEIVGYPPIIVEIPTGPEIPPVKPPDDKLNIWDKEQGGGGGSDSGAGSEKSYPENPKISVDKDEVKKILNLIYDNCMGQLLINAIKSDVTITSGYFGGSTVRPVVVDLPAGPVITGYEVKMGSRLDEIAVMEELMHIYQGLGTVEYRNAAMNYEVEAKLAWYMYWVKTKSTIDIGAALGGDEGENHFGTMMKYLLTNDMKNPAFIEAYDNAVGALRNIKAYQDENRYPFDPGKMDCEKLMELVKDCIDKLN